MTVPRSGSVTVIDPSRPTAVTVQVCRLRTTEPLFFDPYRVNRHTGSFILIDEATNATVGAGMILGEHT